MEAEPATDWGFWAVAVASVSVLWNICNTLFAIYVDRRGKQRSIRLEEFRATVRDPIRIALASVEQIGANARDLSGSNCDLPALRSQSVELNQSCVAALGNLQDALYQADQSKFARGTDWEELFEPLSDKVLVRLNEANNPLHAEHRVRAALTNIHAELRVLKTKITSKLENEVEYQA